MLIKIVRAFLAIGWCRSVSISAMVSLIFRACAYRVVLDKKLEVFDGRQLASFEDSRLSRGVSDQVFGRCGTENVSER